MFKRKIEVNKVVYEVFNEANRYAESVLFDHEEKDCKEVEIAGIKIKSPTDEFLSGRLEGIDLILEQLSDLLYKDTMLLSEEKEYIESVEENIKIALIKINQKIEDKK